VAHLLFSAKDGVANVTLNRPDKGNSLDLPAARELLDTASRCRAADVRAVVLRGAGRHFCLGGDLRVPALADADLHTHVLELTRTLNAALLAFTRLRAPVVAAIAGGVAGAGVGLVGMADLAIAGQSSYFTLAFTGVGMTPDTGTSVWLAEAVGRKRASELLLTNRRLTAAEALDWGLLNAVVPDEELPDAAAAWAHQLAAGPLSAFGATKRLLSAGIEALEGRLDREARTIARQRVSPEGKEGIHAFFERRTADFSGQVNAETDEDLV
jgi:2-(1,2-epoxy-1,2-dihydrophenyl)acetyl-CoA isomerase